MKPLSHIVFLCVLCGTGIAHAQYDFSLVEQLLNDSLTVFHGNVAVQVYEADSLIFNFQAGQVTMDSVVGIASATKWISASVVLTLVDDGLISLDDTLGAYLPVFTQNGKGQITIRQCFSMTSGLISEEQEELNPLFTLAQSVDSIAFNVPLSFEPGTAIAYDGAGMQAVGRVCEIATGLGWRQLAANRILQPLGMTHTAYNRFGLNPAIAGGVTSSGNDYMHMLEMLQDGGVYNGQTVLSPEAVEVFWEYLGDVPILLSPWLEYSEYYPYGTDDPPYGFGSWQMAIQPDSDYVEEISSPGANKTCPWLDRKRDVRAIIFTFIPANEEQGQPTNVKLMYAIRDAMDCKLPVDDLTILPVDDGVSLSWTGHFAGRYFIYSTEDPRLEFPDEWWLEGTVSAAGDTRHVFVDTDLQRSRAHYRILRICE